MPRAGGLGRLQLGRLDALTPSQLLAQLGMAFDQITPVILAGVVHQHQHLAQLAQRGQGFDRLVRQRGDAEHHDALRQAGRALAAAAQLLQARHEARVHRRTRGLGQRLAHIAADAAYSSLTGFKGTAHIYKLMARGDFPRAIKIGERAIAWRLSDVRAYLAARQPVQLSGASYERGYTPRAAQISA